MKSMDWKTRIGIFAVFAGFYGFLLAQYGQVFIYYDDYGYLSLSYGNTISQVVRSDYNLVYMLKFLFRHYTYSNGRLLYLGVFLLSYLVGGLTMVRIVMATVILGIFVISYWVVWNSLREGMTEGAIGGAQLWESGWRPVLLAAFFCLLYGMFGIYYLRAGFYWFSASFIYAIPAITFLAFVMGYQKTAEQRSLSGRQMAGCMVLAFLTGFSQEQWIAAVIGYILLLWGYRLWRGGKLHVSDGAVFVSALVGALPILTSPAVRTRMETHEAFMQTGVFQRGAATAAEVIRLFFSAENKKFIFLMVFLFGCMGIYMVMKKIGNRLVNLAFLAADAMVLVFAFLDQRRGIVIYSECSDQRMIYLFFFVVFYTVQMAVFLWWCRNVRQLLIHLAAFLSIACLVLVPETPYRVFLPYMLLTFSTFAYIFGVIFFSEGRRLFAAVGAAFFLAEAALSGQALLGTYRGYEVNMKVHRYNDAMLYAASDACRRGEDVKQVQLYQIPDKYCAQEMAYYPGFEFMTGWMREYYDLPQAVELQYEILPDLAVLGEYGD